MEWSLKFFARYIEPILRKHNVRTNEVTFIWQLILQSFEPLAKAAKKGIPPARTVEEGTAAARDVLSAIAHGDPKMGVTSKEDMEKWAEAFFATSLAGIAKHHSITSQDVDYVWSAAEQPVMNLKMITEQSIQSAIDNAIKSKFGLHDAGDIRISDLIDAQKEAVDKGLVLDKAE